MYVYVYSITNKIAWVNQIKKKKPKQKTAETILSIKLLTTNTKLTFWEQLVILNQFFGCIIEFLLYFQTFFSPSQM